MDNAFDEENSGPLASDIGYDEAMAKLNASLKRSSSIASRNAAAANGGGNGGGSTGRGSLEGPPPYIFGGGGGSTTTSNSGIVLHDVNVDDDDYGAGSQLPSIEEARTTAASTLSRIERSASNRFPFDDEDVNNEQYNSFIPNGSKRNNRNNNYNYNNSHAENDRRKNWYKFAFFVLIAAVLGTAIGLLVGFTAGEEVERLSEEANGNGNNNNGNGEFGTGTVATTAPRPSAGPAPTSPPDTTPTTPIITAVPTPTPTKAPEPTGIPPPTPSSPTPFPTIKARAHDVMKWLSNAGIAKQTDFANNDSHQFQAAHWIADEDSAKLDLPTAVGDAATRTAFIERYVMALFYFSTKGKAWSYSFRFFSPESVCDWNVDVTLPDSREIEIGVVCNSEKHIVSLNIPQNNLVGTVVTELGLLTNLNFLALNHNVLGGTIPEEMGELTKLSYLALHYNELKGGMPTWIGELSTLRVLGLGDNRLTGSIPSEWSGLENVRTLGLDNNLLTGDLVPLEGYANLERAYLEENTFVQDLAAFPWSQMQKLHELDISSNGLTGSLPADLLNLPLLRVLDLGSNAISGKLPAFRTPNVLRYFGVHGNQISGSIPSTITKLGNLTHLDLSENAFTGLIPRVMGDLKNLQYLFIADNEKLASQVIPSFIGALTNLRDLSLKGTNRVAAIPINLLANLNKLVLLELDNNKLTGEIPSEIGALSTLTYLLLNRNTISGTVPAEVQLLPNLDIFLVDRTDLTGTLDTMCTQRERKPEIAGADCHGDVPEVSCECCNICCAPNGINGTDCRDRVYFGQLDPVWENSYQRRYYQFADEDFGSPNNPNEIGSDDQLGAGITNATTIDATPQDPDNPDNNTALVVDPNND